jgi:aminoglycoside 6-adenylyltransferase
MQVPGNNFSPSFEPQDQVIYRLIKWAEQRDAIRAMLLTSTRAIPTANVDRLSDYDVVLVVEDIHPFHEDRHWVHDFGNILVTYWDPIYPEPDHGMEKFGNVIQYADGLKIDFTLWPVELLRKIVQAQALTAELDAGYRILLDKDHLTETMSPPGYRAYIPTLPTNEIYQRVIEEFFSDAPYAAKCILRNELFPVKWCLDYDMKHVYLRLLLEWYVGLIHHESVPVGSLGKGLRKHLPPEIWSQLESCYAGAGNSENWEALFRTLALFRRVAMEVGERLDYEYPLDLDERVTAFVKDMQADQQTERLD